jgi:Leucine-rich repeat (LRR) protein
MKLFKSLSQALKTPQEVGALKLSLTGALPIEIANFPFLKELYLEGVCGNFELPTSSLLELRILSVKCDRFSGNIADLFRLRHLENLKIIETPIPKFLLPIGSILSPLRSLTIKSCGLEELPEEFGMLNSLSELNLSGNNLKTLPYSFVDLIRLKRLNLDQNQFSLFPDIIGKMSSLSHLSIDGNAFSEDEKARIQRQYHIWPN